MNENPEIEQTQVTKRFYKFNGTIYYTNGDTEQIEYTYRYTNDGFMYFENIYEGEWSCTLDRNDNPYLTNSLNENQNMAISVHSVKKVDDITWTDIVAVADVNVITSNNGWLRGCERSVEPVGDTLNFTYWPIDEWEAENRDE